MNADQTTASSGEPVSESSRSLLITEINTQSVQIRVYPR